MNKKLKKELPFLAFIVPAFIVYTVLTMYPLIQTIWLSFTNWDGYSMSNLSFVGLENFKAVLADKSMKSALLNTLFYSLVFPILTTIFAIPLSLALNSKMKSRNLQRAVFFFPSISKTTSVTFVSYSKFTPCASKYFTIGKINDSY